MSETVDAARSYNDIRADIRRAMLAHHSPKLSAVAECKWRGPVLATITGRVAGCGCSGSTVEVYRCEHFHEPVIKQGRPPCLDSLREQVPGATGLTCQTCKVPKQPCMELIQLTDGDLSQTTSRGIVTAASEDYWPCVAALALGAQENGVGFAVADHGFTAWQRQELTRIGARWIEHPKPDLSQANGSKGIICDIRCWWKPLVCLASPFEQSIWVDSDAVIVGDLSELFEASKDGLCTAFQQTWMGESQRLYRNLADRLFGAAGVSALDELAHFNSGVVAWRRGELVLNAWSDWCLRLSQDSELAKLCHVRDQSGHVIACVDNRLKGHPSAIRVGNEWNYPADGLPAKECKSRKRVPLAPAELVRVTRERHPDAKIVHWLGKPKPWQIG